MFLPRGDSIQRDEYITKRGFGKAGHDVVSLAFILAQAIAVQLDFGKLLDYTRPSRDRVVAQRLGRRNL
ncbi:MAG TPA: hypothetical protein VLC95_16580 [Anaerolineae bacterium]|nr:hypothetical protein [Anaerolineae bacterium]